MEISTQELIAQFRELSDAALLERIGAGTLIPLAYDLALQELNARGLTLSAVAEGRVPKELEWGSGEAQDDLVTVARFTLPLQAQVIRARLETEGIFAFVAGEHLGTAHAVMSVAAGSVQLQVPRHQEAAAKSILAAIDRGDYALEEEV
ncbi:MAG TPA: DUF2007 domain-containing protein [Steroidobacteraceae bacterium]